MNYRYYKFPNKESMPPFHMWPRDVSITQLGTLYSNETVYDDYGNLILVPLEGWHVNICYSGNVNLDFISQYEIQVNTPVRTWFGQEV